MTQVLARKWRPRIFAELVGQEHVVKALTNALRERRLHHAYLFTGTRGVGKTTLARILSKALNCEGGVSAEPCGTCRACTEIDAGRFVDLVELDAASNTQVDNMRELLESALYAPTSGRYKVYIIDEVHMLSRNAFNAMLKTLEEPPEHVKFVLATTDPQKIPVTVLSRCLQFNLKQISQVQIRAQLQKVLDAEGFAFEIPALALLARAAQGSMRDGLSLLDQAIAHGGGKVEEGAVRGMLGAVDSGYLYSLLKALAARDAAALIAEADRMAQRSLSFELALQDLGVLLHRLALLQALPASVAEDEPDREVLLALAALFGAEDLQLYYQIALQGRADIALAPDDYAGFTMTLLRMLAFAPEEPGAELPAAASRAAKPPAGVVPTLQTGPSKKNDSKRDWPDIVAELELTGMARMLAQHCELVRHEARRMELSVPQVHERLLDKPYQDKLRAALQQRFGPELRVAFSVGEGNGNSPAALADRDRQRRHAEAVAEIEQDPFVRELVENFDARIVESTIKPIQQ
ncbi:MAG: DNA polymerase III subunit gamma/tau [Betaproteobacteria bacterium]